MANPKMNVIYRMFLDAAKRGEACPSNLDIAAMIDTGIGQAASLVTAMEKDGWFTVRRSNKARVVTFPNGLTTLDTIGKNIPHWRDKAGRIKHLRGLIDQVAEHVANGESFASTARLMGVSVDRVKRLFNTIRLELGWQAQ